MRLGVQMIALLDALEGRQEATTPDLYHALIGRYEPLSHDSIFVALTRMKKSGWITCRKDDPPPHKGGPRRLHYQITPAGREALLEGKKRIAALMRITSPLAPAKPVTRTI
jgi:DNA-binding PadR family transcriptional regulator